MTDTFEAKLDSVDRGSDLLTPGLASVTAVLAGTMAGISLGVGHGHSAARTVALVLVMILLAAGLTAAADLAVRAWRGGRGPEPVRLVAVIAAGGVAATGWIILVFTTIGAVRGDGTGWATVALAAVLASAGSAALSLLRGGLAAAATPAAPTATVDTAPADTPATADPGDTGIA